MYCTHINITSHICRGCGGQQGGKNAGRSQRGVAWRVAIWHEAQRRRHGRPGWCRLARMSCTCTRHVNAAPSLVVSGVGFFCFKLRRRDGPPASASVTVIPALFCLLSWPLPCSIYPFSPSESRSSSSSMSGGPANTITRESARWHPASAPGCEPSCMSMA